MKRNRLTGMVLDHIGRGTLLEPPPVIHTGPFAGDEVPLSAKERQALIRTYDAQADADLAAWEEARSREDAELLAGMDALSGEPELLQLLADLDCEALGP